MGMDAMSLFSTTQVREFLISGRLVDVDHSVANADSYSTGLVADADNDGKDDFTTYSVGFKRWSAYKRTGSQILRKSQIAGDQ